MAYVPPGYNILQTRLLHDEVNRIDQQTEKIRHFFTTFGATICSNSWLDVKNHPLINFMNVGPEGEIFEGSVDALRYKKTNKWMATDSGDGKNQ